MKTSKYKKCSMCKKRLKLIQNRCKCGKYFCFAHLPSSAHKCKYDYREEYRRTLLEKLPKIGSSKNYKQF